MRHHRESTRHVSVFFTCHFPELCPELHFKTLKPQLAFYVPNYAVYCCVVWQLDITLLEAFITYNSDVNQNINYFTPIRQLFYSCMTPYRKQVVRILLQAGANTTDIIDQNFALTGVMTQLNDDDSILFFEGARGANFDTALEFAVEHRRPGLIPYLISLGANPRCFNDSPIFTAAKCFRLDIIKVLLEGGAVVTDSVLEYTMYADRDIYNFLLETSLNSSP